MIIISNFDVIIFSRLVLIRFINSFTKRQPTERLNALFESNMIKLWFQQAQIKPVIHNDSEACGDLWDLVLDMNWELVVAHAKKHPQDAEWQDGHWHETPLYLACQHNPPIEAVREIIKAYPGAVLVPSGKNRDLPLHIACRYQATVGVLEEITRDCPMTTIEQTRWGRTPVMALWEYRPQGQTLTEDFWAKIIVLLSAVARFRDHRRFECREHTSSIEASRSLHMKNSIDAWDDGESDILMLHSAVSLGSLGCPLEVLQYVLKRWPHQVFLRDRQGRLPLHIVVGPTSWCRTTKRKYKPREREFLLHLLRAYPLAVNEKVQGDSYRYPLHCAIANRHTWSGGVMEIFYAGPHVLLIQDPVTKLYPFQLAAIPKGESKKVDLDTIYNLLRVQPDVMMHFNWKQFDLSVPNSAEKRPDTQCPAVIEDALLGTLSAVLVGSVAGLVFA